MDITYKINKISGKTLQLGLNTGATITASADDFMFSKPLQLENDLTFDNTLIKSNTLVTGKVLNSALISSKRFALGAIVAANNQNAIIVNTSNDISNPSTIQLANILNTESDLFGWNSTLGQEISNQAIVQSSGSATSLPSSKSFIQGINIDKYGRITGIHYKEIAGSDISSDGTYDNYVNWLFKVNSGNVHHVATKNTISLVGNGLSISESPSTAEVSGGDVEVSFTVDTDSSLQLVDNKIGLKNIGIVRENGLYKVATNTYGLVTAASAVTKTDLTDLIGSASTTEQGLLPELTSPTLIDTTSVSYLSNANTWKSTSVNKVSQQYSEDDANYDVLMKNTGDDKSTNYDTTKFSNKLHFNPSTGLLTSTSLAGNLSVDYLTGVIASSKLPIISLAKGGTGKDLSAADENSVLYTTASGFTAVANPTVSLAAGAAYDSSKNFVLTKLSTGASGTSNVIPSWQNINDIIGSQIAASQALIFKGVLKSASDLPKTGYLTGWMYKVGASMTIYGENLDVGDSVYCISDYSSDTGAVAADWVFVQSNLDNAVGYDASLTTSSTGNVIPLLSSDGLTLNSSGILFDYKQAEAGDYKYYVHATAAKADLAATATALTTSAGSDSQPVYFADGKPVTITGAIANDTTGNSATATKLKNARTFTINNSEKSFDGSADVSWTLADIGLGGVADDSAVVHKTGDETIDGVKTFNSTIKGNLSGNASTASALTSDAGSTTQAVYFSDGKPVPATGILNNDISGNSASATKLLNSRNIFGQAFNGTADVSGIGTFNGTHTATSVNTYLNSALLIRENDLVGNDQSDLSYGPSIGFDWDGKTNGGASIQMDYNGYLHFLQKDGTTTNTIYANLNGNAATSTKADALALSAAVGDNKHAVYFNSLGLPVIAAGVLANDISGNAATTSALKTPIDITIGNTTKSFDGSADMTWTIAEMGLDGVATDSSVVHNTGDETIAGSKTFTSDIIGNLSGNASTATALTTSAGSNTQAVYFASGKPVEATGILNNSISGNSASATQLKNTRSFTIGTVSKDFNGTADVSWSLNELGLGNTSDDSKVVHLAGAETITGFKTFNSPADVANAETNTVWFNTSNTGRIGIGKDKTNSGSSLFLDQVSGTRRLTLSGTTTDGEMIWSQPETDAKLYFDVPTISFRSAGFILNSGAFYPSADSTKSLGSSAAYFNNSYINNEHVTSMYPKTGNIINVIGTSSADSGFVKFGSDTNVFGYNGTGLKYGANDVLTSGNSYIKDGTITIDGTSIIPATLVGGKVPAAQLPSYVDDVVEADSFSKLPTTGETGKIYVTLDDNKTYRWGGTAYAIISDTIAIGETAGTAYDGALGKALADYVNTLSDTVTNKVVHTTGDETIEGAKTFKTTIIGSITGDAGGNAATATALTSNAGSNTQAVYFAEGKPVAATGTLANDISGNSATATQLANSRNFIINGSSKAFNGTANVEWTLKDIGLDTVATDSTVVHNTGDETIAGNKTFTSDIIGNITGNAAGTAASANALTINAGSNTQAVYFAGGIPVIATGTLQNSITGNAAGNAATATALKNAQTFSIAGVDKSFNGTAGVSWTLTELGLANRADDSKVVHLADDETITGTKTFAKTSWVNTNPDTTSTYSYWQYQWGDEIDFTKRSASTTALIDTVWSIDLNASSITFDYVTSFANAVTFKSSAYGVTATAGDSSTLLATTAFVTTADNKLQTNINTETTRAKAAETVLTNTKESIANKGIAGGYASLGDDGKVPSTQLPSYVDDVIEADSLSAFPTTGEAGKIYVALDTNKTYRWGGTKYAIISDTLAIGTTTGTAYEGSAGAANAAAISALQTSIKNDVVHLDNAETIVGSKTFTSPIIGNITGNAGSADILTADAGSANQPIYFEGGRPVAIIGNISNSITGNAATATKFETARTIFGQSFDGTANVSGMGTFNGTHVSAADSKYLNSALLIRENGLAGKSQTDISYGPAIGFDWNDQIDGGALIQMDTTGYLHFFKKDGSSLNTIYATLNGNASTATALTTSAGSATQPIYFAEGKPVAITGDIANSTTGNAATASKLKTATIFTINNSAKTFNGNNDITWTLKDLGLDTVATDSTVVHNTGDETIAGSKTFSSDIIGNITGNAATATKANALALSGAVGSTTQAVYFSAAGLPVVANGTLNNSISGDAAGNAATATALKNAQNFSIAGVSKSFNGTAGVSWTLSELGLANRADDTKVVHLAGTETITGAKTFAAPTDTADTESNTVWFNTSNGGRIGLGKDKTNSGSSLFLDQTSGNRRLNLSATATDGVMIWSQPETDAILYFDVPTVSFRTAGFMLSNNVFRPTTNNAASIGSTSAYLKNLYSTALYSDTLNIKSGNIFNIIGSTDTSTGYVKFGTDTNTLGYNGTTLTYGTATVLTSGNSNIKNGTITINGTSIIPATLVDGKVPSAQLPSYVDDVIEAESFAKLPTTGEAGKIYVTLDNNKTYRWGGTAYAIISDTLAIGETAGTAYDGASGKALADSLASLKSTVTNDVVHTTGDETIAGNKTFSSTITGNISGNSGTADALKTARTLTIGNSGKSFDGTADVSWPLSDIGAADDSAVVHLAGAETITGSKTFTEVVDYQKGFNITGGYYNGSAERNARMEIGKTDGGAATNPYIDFHTDGSATTDYNIRLLASGSYLYMSGTFVVQNVLPRENNTWTSGSTGLKWKNIYATTFTGNLAGNAITADALNTDAGSATQPIYFASGKPVAITGVIANSTTGNAATATKLSSDHTIFGQTFNGTSDVSGIGTFNGNYNTTAAYLNAGLIIRENGLVSNNQTAISYGPSISFDWDNTTAALIQMDTAGFLHFVKKNGAAINTIYATVSGNASTATALTTSAGSATQPIYFASGKPVAITGVIANSTTGNAATATKLAADVTFVINGSSKTFSGNNNLSWTLTDIGLNNAADNSLVVHNTGDETIAGSKTFSSAITGDLLGTASKANALTANAGSNTQAVYFSAGVPVAATGTLANSITGNAGTATALKTARTLTIGKASNTFDGSKDVSWSLVDMGLGGIADDDLVVHKDGTETITGSKTFNSPADVASTETVTTWFNTSNGGRIGFGKDATNSGTSLFLDQTSGTRRLSLSATATDGQLIWSQPETDSKLTLNVSNIAYGTMGYAMTSGAFYPTTNNSRTLGTSSYYFNQSYVTSEHLSNLYPASGNVINLYGTSNSNTGYIKFGSDAKAFGYDGTALKHGDDTILTSGNSYITNGTVTINGTSITPATLVDGKVPSTQLPSYVDDVIEAASFDKLPTTGESGKIYVALDTNKTYRWGGTAYAVISDTLAIGTTTGTAYDGASGAANASAISTLQTTVANSVVHTTGNETIAGTKTFSSTIAGSINGNAASANKVNKTLSWSGLSTGSFNGSADSSFVIPNNTNQLTNGAGYITGITAAMVDAVGTLTNSTSGNAATASKAVQLSNAHTIFGQSFNGTANVSGIGTFNGTYTATDTDKYINSALLIRENGLVSKNQTATGYGPSIGFDWDSTNGALIQMDTSGYLHFFKKDGASTNTIYATLEGTAQKANSLTLSSAVGSTTQAVYFTSSGLPAVANGTLANNISGNSNTATTLQTARTFTIGSKSKSFNGSANVSWTLAELGLGDTAADTAVVHLAGAETITGEKSFKAATVWTDKSGATTLSSYSSSLSQSGNNFSFIKRNSSSNADINTAAYIALDTDKINVNYDTTFAGNVYGATAAAGNSSTLLATTAFVTAAGNKLQTNINTEVTRAKAAEATLASTKESVANKGVAGGYASLDGNGKVPSSQLPSYVDDVLEATNYAALPTAGETEKIYVTLDDNKTYRWSGTAYVEISSSLALGETSSTAYPGDKGAANASAISTLQSAVVHKTGNETIAGTKTFSSTIAGSISGNAATAIKVNKTLSWSGYSSGSFDGSAAGSIAIPNNTNQLINGAGYITGITAAMVDAVGALTNSTTGNAATASKAVQLTNVRTIFGQSFNGTANVAGIGTFSGTHVTSDDTKYLNSALLIRENGLVGSAQTDTGYGPSIGFDWDSTTGALIQMDTSGYLHFFKKDGASTNTIYANVSGNASTATALTTSAGTATQPVYFASGKPVAITGAIANDTTGTAAKATADANGNVISSTYLKLSGGTMTGTIESHQTTLGTDKNVLYGCMGANDFYRLRIGGAKDAGFIALETADGGNETISVAQYTGNYTYETEARRAYLLDGSGKTSFPVSVTSPSFIGALTGNATTATALQTAQTLSINGVGKSFNGTAGLSWTLSELGLSNRADDSKVVHLAGAETITGNKTFSSKALWSNSNSETTSAYNFEQYQWTNQVDFVRLKTADSTTSEIWNIGLDTALITFDYAASFVNAVTFKSSAYGVTAAAGNNSTLLATTAFVTAADSTLQSALQTKITAEETRAKGIEATKQDMSAKGKANGYASLDSSGLVPTSQLPSYVDDVLEYDTYADLPTTGETGKIYVTLDTNKTYRWGGTAYVVISETLAVGTTAGTAYDGAAGQSLATQVASLQNTSAVDTAVVHKTGNETIAGTKTFSSTIAGSINGNAATATALTTNAGSTTQPIYFASGKPVIATGTLSNSISGNAATATKATKDSGGNVITKYNTYIGVDQAVSHATTKEGYWAGMLNSSQTGAPTLPSSGWWHVMSMDWAGGDYTNWISQLAIPTQDNSSLYYRKNAAGNTSIDSSSWVQVLDAKNYTAYTASKAAALTTNAGSATQAVYFANGIPVIASGTLANSISGNAATATTATSANKVANALTFGSTTYDGSAAKTITLSSLGGIASISGSSSGSGNVISNISVSGSTVSYSHTSVLASISSPLFTIGAKDSNYNSAISWLTAPATDGGVFYSGTTAPSKSNRLNYDGILYASNVYAKGLDSFMPVATERKAISSASTGSILMASTTSDGTIYYTFVQSPKSFNNTISDWTSTSVIPNANQVASRVAAVVTSHSMQSHCVSMTLSASALTATSSYSIKATDVIDRVDVIVSTPFDASATLTLACNTTELTDLGASDTVYVDSTVSSANDVLQFVQQLSGLTGNIVGTITSPSSTAGSIIIRVYISTPNLS